VAGTNIAKLPRHAQQPMNRSKNNLDRQFVQTTSLNKKTDKADAGRSQGKLALERGK
jgi:hypothetical protein